MFIDWNFLILEMWGLLALAALLGLITGWVFSGRGENAVLAGEAAALRADLEKCRAMHTEKDARIEALEASVRERHAVAAPRVDLSQGHVSDAGGYVKPTTLTVARGGTPDDLTKINGVGPKLEALCHRLGFFHFDQIAAWSASEVAWVDENLEGFKGRVTRDGWVSQAQRLAQGGGTAF
ncbi:MAG: hypothetical protein AAGB11_20495 [Pseudomonadota bacterium]